jgi:hypothetical protein
MTCDNAAFQDGNQRAEIARILRTVAAELDYGDRSGPVRDINGNTVGDYRLTGREG